MMGREHWVESTIGQLCFTTSGGTPSRANKTFFHGSIPWIKSGELKDGIIDKAEEHISKEAIEKSSAKLFPKDTILIALYGATIGKLGILGIEAATNQAVCAIFESKALDDKFLFCYLLSERENLIKAGFGAAQPNISQQTIRDYSIPLPPLNEQKRIVEKLDAILPKVKSAKARLEKIPGILKKFRQSVLAAASSGRLTEDWREEKEYGTGKKVVEKDSQAKNKLVSRYPELLKKKSSVNATVDSSYEYDIPITWVFSTWGMISEWITYGFTRPMPNADSGVRLLTAKDVINFNIRIEESGFTTKKAFESLSDKDRPEKGDLLITKDGSIGRAALVKTNIPFCINQSVAVCWLRSTGMDKCFLEIVANADFTQRFVVDKSKGMAIQHLSITDFAQCPVPIPPVEEQQEIVRRVEKLFSLADSLEAKYKKAMSRVEKIEQSVLAKAFRGELVEPDPNDEPAEELLKRILKEKKLIEGKSRTGKTIFRKID